MPRTPATLIPSSPVRHLGSPRLTRTFLSLSRRSLRVSPMSPTGSWTRMRPLCNDLPDDLLACFGFLLLLLFFVSIFPFSHLFVVFPCLCRCVCVCVCVCLSVCLQRKKKKNSSQTSPPSLFVCLCLGSLLLLFGDEAACRLEKAYCGRSGHRCRGRRRRW